MTKLILATIYLCTLSNQCETHQVRVEPKACHFGSVKGQAPINGEWENITISIKCK